MKLVSTIAAASALAAAAVAAQPVVAQKPAAAQPAAPARKFNISPQARKPLTDLQSAVSKKDEAAYPAALAAAQAAATNSDEKYVVAKLRLQHAIDTGDKKAQMEALQATIDSGGADAAESLQLTHYIGALAAQTADWPRAEAAFTTVLVSTPNDLDSLVDLARAKIELKKVAEALPLLQHAIAISKAAGQTPPEPWFRNALAIAYQTKNQAAVQEINADLLRYYPSGQNLTNAILLYNEGANLPKDAELDLLRLLYVSGGMTDSNSYFRLAAMLETSGLPGEEKTVVESGMRAGKLGGADAQQMLQRSNARIAADRASLPGVEQKARAAGTGTLAASTAMAYASYGDYAKAVDLYRVALQKGGVDPDLVNTRLGIALALSGYRPEAETAFKAVSGARARLAGLWLTWLAQRS
jgi:tetratricopeptide (TPR) repeat protein